MLELDSHTIGFQAHAPRSGSALRNAGTLMRAHTLLTDVSAIRRTSQKPSDELYRNFKANFPELSGAHDSPTSSAPAHAQPTTSLAEALDIPLNPR